MQLLARCALIGVALTTLPFTVSAQHTGQGESADLGKVYFGFYNSPPGFYTENGKPTGTSFNITREHFSEAGLSVNYMVMPVGRLYSQVNNTDRLQLWMAVETPYFLGMGNPVKPNLYRTLRLNLYGLSGNKPPTFDDLGAHPLIAVVGYSYGGKLDQLKKKHPDLVILYANNHESAFRMLAAGRAPYIMDYQLQASMALRKLNIKGLEVTSVQNWEVFLFVSKNAPHSDVLLQRLEAASHRIITQRQTVLVDK